MCYYFPLKFIFEYIHTEDCGIKLQLQNSESFSMNYTILMIP